MGRRFGGPGYSGQYPPRGYVDPRQQRLVIESARRRAEALARARASRDRVRSPQGQDEEEEEAEGETETKPQAPAEGFACPQCEKPIQPYTENCPSCGEPLEWLQDEAPQNTEGGQEQQQ